MPNISIYLKEETLKAIQAKAKIEKRPLSRIIREAIEQYLDIAETKEAKERVMKRLMNVRPLRNWEELHKERTVADAHRY